MGVVAQQWNVASMEGLACYVMAWFCLGGGSQGEWQVSEPSHFLGLTYVLAWLRSQQQAHVV